MGGVVITNSTGTVTTSVDTFHFEGTNLTFDVTGLAVETSGKASATGPTVSKSLSIKGAGEGIVGAGGNNNAVVVGAITIGAGKLE